MSNRRPTEDEYYAHIAWQLGEQDDYLMDNVLDLEEWRRCKRALMRWVADQDAEFDELARRQERGEAE